MAYFRCTGNSGGSLKLRTAQGEIASFETNLPEPYQSVTVDVEATQSGSGTPYPPGGGKNKFDKSTVNHGALINGSGNYVSYPNNNVSDYTPVVEGVGYYLYGITQHPNTLQDNFELFDGSKTKVGYANVRTNEYPYTIPSGVKFVRFTVHDDDLNTAMFATSEGEYEPYSNVRPINGYSSANITRCGVNLLSGKLEDYQASTRTYGLSTFIAYKLPNGTYTISTNAPTGYIWAGKSLDNGSLDTSTYFRVYDGNPLTITLSGTQDLIVGVLTTDMETSCSYNTMVNIGSTPLPYAPYNGQTYTIAFGQTVYGGVLDVTMGKLHVTHELMTYDGSENWLLSGAVFYIGIASEYRTEQKPICNIYDGVNPVFYQNLPDGKIALSTVVLNNLLVRDDSIATVEDFKTALSNQNMQVVLKLATPFDIDLTPVQIRALVGENNVFADTGDTEVKYLYLE